MFSISWPLPGNFVGAIHSFQKLYFPVPEYGFSAFRISKVLASDSASDREKKRFGTKVPEKGGCWGKLGGEGSFLIWWVKKAGGYKCVGVLGSYVG